MIQDMYNEEYFVQLLKANAPGQDSLFYKYFTELSEVQLAEFNTEEINQEYASQRGTMLGVTLPNCSAWLNQSKEEERPKQCLIKLYDDHARNFKLNDVVTFIGHLEFNKAEIGEDTPMKGAQEDEEMRTGIPNEHILPHLHVFAYRNNQRLINNPVLKKKQATSAIVKSLEDNLSETRDKILAILKLILNGDAFAAEYLMVSWLSRVHTRKDAFIIGHLPINITGVTFLQGRYLSKFFKAVTPFIQNLPLSIDVLENAKFPPRKNYDTNILEPGLLQMIEGTFVFADETVLKEGQVKGEGVSNIKALATLIEQQVVEYDFQFYQQSYPINAAVILISDGRSMFKNTLQVPLQAAKSTGSAPAARFDEEKFNQILADEELLNQIRRFYLLLSTFSDTTLEDYHIPPEVSEYAQQVFVDIRKTEHDTRGEVKTNADNFH